MIAFDFQNSSFNPPSTDEIAIEPIVNVIPSPIYNPCESIKNNLTKTNTNAPPWGAITPTLSDHTIAPTIVEETLITGITF